MEKSVSKKVFGCIACVALTVLCSACFERTIFPAQPIGADGEFVFVEDIDDILTDPSLTPDQQSDALRAIGIESQTLIDSLVEDGLGTPVAPPPVDDGGGDGGDGGDGGGDGG